MIEKLVLGGTGTGDLPILSPTRFTLSLHASYREWLPRLQNRRLDGSLSTCPQLVNLMVKSPSGWPPWRHTRIDAQGHSWYGNLAPTPLPQRSRLSAVHLGQRGNLISSANSVCTKSLAYWRARGVGRGLCCWELWTFQTAWQFNIICKFEVCTKKICLLDSSRGRPKSFDWELWELTWIL